MTYEEAIAWWFAHVNFEQRAPGATDLRLGRMYALMRALGGPHERLRIVHVAGSKGKGSTSAMLATLLQRSGYRTGLFTSPHLVRLEERFQVDGRPITRAELAQLLTDCRAADEARGIGPTFFEIATAAGFLHFERRGVDAVVLEVGLGGRLDSTNVCQPALSVITSISYDHTKTLGSQLWQIAREKAGILKPGRPGVSGVVLPEPRQAIEEVARSLRVPLRQAGEDFRFEYQPGRVTEAEAVRPRVRVTTRERAWPWQELNLLGEHQAANAAVVVACVEVLRELGWSVPDRAVEAGLREVDWPARMEVVRRRPLVVLDCAHNVASAQALVRTLEASFPPGPRALLCAASNDKDVAGMFDVLRPAFRRAVMTRYTNNARAVAPDELARLWGPGCEECPDPAEALGRVLAGGEGLACITGSVFLAGQLRPLLVGQG